MKAPELLALSIDWLKKTHRHSIIVTEMSVADWGGARIDVAAITETEIVGIEIKGDGDSSARLELQGLVYGRVARKMWLLASEDLSEKCRKKNPKGWGVLEVHNGAVRPRGISRFDNAYRPSKPSVSKSLTPHHICGTLWRDELYDIARLNGMPVKSRDHVGALTEAICDHIPVTKLHDLMIEALRRRQWKKPVIDMRDLELRMQFGDDMNTERQTDKIRTIRSLDELAGYEAQAKTRGILPEEVRAIAAKRRELGA